MKEEAEKNGNDAEKIEREEVAGDDISGSLSRREKRMLRHRTEILEAAKELFAVQGYDGTSMQQIADRVDLSVGKLYTHFKGKESIHLEIAKELRRLHLEVSDESCRPGMTSLEMLRARIRATTDFLLREKSFIRINRQLNTCCKDSFEKMGKEDHGDILERLICEAVEKGELDPGFDPVSLSTMIEGAAMRFVEINFEDDEKLKKLPEYLDLAFLNQFETGSGTVVEDKKESR